MLTQGAIEAIGAPRHGRAKGALPAEAGLRRMDRHDEPDRAAGRLGPGAVRTPGGSRRRRTTASPARRSSSPGATTTWPTTSSIWCWPALPDAPAGSARHLAVRGAEVPGQCRTGRSGAGNDLRCGSLEHKLGIHGCPTCVMAVRRQGRRRRLSGRRAEPRPRAHVHHDERAPG